MTLVYNTIIKCHYSTITRAIMQSFHHSRRLNGFTREVIAPTKLRFTPTVIMTDDDRSQQHKTILSLFEKRKEIASQVRQPIRAEYKPPSEPIVFGFDDVIEPDERERITQEAVLTIERVYQTLLENSTYEMDIDTVRILSSIPDSSFNELLHTTGSFSYDDIVSSILPPFRDVAEDLREFLNTKRDAIHAGRANAAMLTIIGAVRSFREQKSGRIKQPVFNGASPWGEIAQAEWMSVDKALSRMKSSANRLEAGYIVMKLSPKSMKLERTTDEL